VVAPAGQRRRPIEPALASLPSGGVDDLDVLSRIVQASGLGHSVTPSVCRAGGTTEEFRAGASRSRPAMWGSDHEGGRLTGNGAAETHPGQRLLAVRRTTGVDLVLVGIDRPTMNPFDGVCGTIWVRSTGISRRVFAQAHAVGSWLVVATPGQVRLVRQAPGPTAAWVVHDPPRPLSGSENQSRGTRSGTSCYGLDADAGGAQGQCERRCRDFFWARRCVSRTSVAPTRFAPSAALKCPGPAI